MPGQGVTVMRDLPYAPGSRHALDIYRPATPDGSIMVFLYGGTWRTGTKEMYAFVGRAFAERGITVVVPDYRLYPDVTFPDFLTDNALAVAWTAQRAAALGAEPARLFVVGHSAGAYNAAMLALDPRFLGAARLSRARLAGVAGLAGPYDFLPIDDPDVMPVFASAADNLAATQPVSFADGSNPPLLLLTGADDRVVKPRNTTSLANRVGLAGGPVQSRVYPGIGHIGILTALTPLFAGRAAVRDDLLAFIGSHRAAAC